MSLTITVSLDIDLVAFFPTPDSPSRYHPHSELLPDSEMFTEAEYVSLKGLKDRSPEEETRWQTVQQERRKIQQTEAMRIKRAAATEKEKDAERARVREKRAKYTVEEAGAATQRNTEQRRLARSKGAAGGVEEMLIREVSENGEVLSKRSVPG